MPDRLVRMLKSHEFLLRSLEEHGRDLAPQAAEQLQRRIDRLFLNILTHEALDPRITLVQVRFLLDNLLEMVADPDKGEALHDLCNRHIARLDKKLAVPPPAPAPPEPREFAYLDNLSDRVAIVDTEYRYVFTNKANLKFHGKTMQSFIGRPNWELVGARFFEQASKHYFDACLAGQPQCFSSPHPLGDSAVIYSIKMEPISGDDGRIGSVLVVSRDITDQLAAAARTAQPGK